MEPHIQYARTKDGVSIAFWTMGEGPPLLYLPPFWQHAQLDWQMPTLRQFYEWLSARRLLVRIDPRNNGLSQRRVEDISLEAGQRDIAAVADRLGIEQFSLFGHGASGQTAIAFAANQPHRVRRLIIFNSTPSTVGTQPTAARRALALLIDEDWETFSETAAGMIWGWADGDETRRYAALLRASATQDDTRRWAAGRYDVSEFLPRISAPTLIVHPRDAVLTTIETGRRLAAEIPHARLVSLEGRGMSAGFADPHMMSAVDGFLDEDGEAKPPALQPHGTAIILFADIVESTALTERMGDAAFRDASRALDISLRTIITAAGGMTIEAKTLGDGVLATFLSASQAIAAALACGGAGDGSGLPLHLGLHAGDVIREADNVYGGAVNIAARISALAAPGEVLVSDTVRSLGRTSAGVVFEDRGEQALKGVEDAVRVYAVRSQP